MMHDPSHPGEVIKDRTVLQKLREISGRINGIPFFLKCCAQPGYIEYIDIDCASFAPRNECPDTRLHNSPAETISDETRSDTVAVTSALFSQVHEMDGMTRGTSLRRPRNLWEFFYRHATPLP